MKDLNQFKNSTSQSFLKQNAEILGIQMIKLSEPIQRAPVESDGEKMWLIDIEPVPAPRMTRRDKWLKPRRPAVGRYFAYRDALKTAVGEVLAPDEIHLVFTFTAPESWSKKKRNQMIGKPHKVRPDRDNLEKAVLDALFAEDCAVWKGSQKKVWGLKGSVQIEMIWHKI